MVEPKFAKGDYIINRKNSFENSDIAIVKGVTKKGYYQFSALYGGMFHEFKDVSDKNYDLQINYQKFYDLCTDEEKEKFDALLKEKGGK
jgi:hypothetical protein